MRKYLIWHSPLHSAEKFFRPPSEEKSTDDFIEEQKAKATEEGVESVTDGMTPEEQRDAASQAKWLQPSNDDPRLKAGLTLLVFFCIWVFLLTLSIMGTGFKLLGGKSSAKMFDVADNPISALLIGVLATVLVQSSSTSTSIIISMVGADELSASSLRGGGRRVLALLDGARIESVAVELLGLSPAAAARLECARGACLGLSHGPRGWSLERSNVLDPGGGRVAD